jgi:hypothetical protein
MTPTLNLYLDMEFTSLSPDSQPISIGIVIRERPSLHKHFIPNDVFYKKLKNGLVQREDYRQISIKNTRNTDGWISGYVPLDIYLQSHTNTTSFYCEFNDFDISRCDDWVKENVVTKLRHYPGTLYPILGHDYSDDPVIGSGSTRQVQTWLKEWLDLFYEFNLQIVVDCGTYDWYHFVQLIAEWDKKEDHCNGFHGRCPSCGIKGNPYFKIGLPKLPKNISPVPADLNDLIAIKKGITPKDAFDLNREDMALDSLPGEDANEKHNALWDAKIIKIIYNKLR